MAEFCNVHLWFFKLHKVWGCVVPLDGSLVEILEGKEKSSFEFLKTVDGLCRRHEDFWFVLEGFVQGLCNCVSHSFERFWRPELFCYSLALDSMTLAWADTQTPCCWWQGGSWGVEVPPQQRDRKIQPFSAPCKERMRHLMPSLLRTWSRRPRSRGWTDTHRCWQAWHLLQSVRSHLNETAVSLTVSDQVENKKTFWEKITVC